MAITLQVSYKETLKPETVTKIDELVDDNYAIEDILEFVDAHGEDDFVSFYETYVEQGEAVGYDVVDVFIAENGIAYVEHTQDAFVGIYNSEADFTEEYMSDMGYDIPVYIVVDWQATWDQSLRYDFTFVDGYVFRNDY